jgi:hypothetical protein
MTTFPSDEEVGMQILNIYRQYKKRPGEFLPQGVFLVQIEKSECRIDDLPRGFIWLKENNYVQDSNRGYVLTEDGFNLLC